MTDDPLLNLMDEKQRAAFLAARQAKDPAAGGSTLIDKLNAQFEASQQSFEARNVVGARLTTDFGGRQ